MSRADLSRRIAVQEQKRDLEYLRVFMEVLASIEPHPVDLALQLWILEVILQLHPSPFWHRQRQTEFDQHLAAMAEEDRLYVQQIREEYRAASYAGESLSRVSEKYDPDFLPESVA